jgi:aminoglycoside/choline kinase family phosphotransferase
MPRVKTIEKRRADAREVRERLELYLERSGLRSKTLTIVPLTGDASDRKYFRLVARDGPALVLALHPQPFDFATLPFVRVAALLNQMPLPVPSIVAHADDLGVLVLQDLGDVTLQAYLGAVPAREQLGLYRLAVSFLEILQRRGEELASPELPPYKVAFDLEKLLWELDFFTKHFIEGYRGTTIPASERAALGEEWVALAGELAAEPRVLCHRDYHSRNLMVSAGDLYIIDFQDARLGPDTYDLASLLRDSYVDLSEDAVDELLRHFVALKTEGKPAESAASWASTFRRRFDCMSLQRNLKALGTFGYQTAARGNPVYIQYIPRTLRYVKRNLTRHSRFGRLHGVLAGLIDELN